MTSSIWDLPERGTRGPKPRYDRAAIAALAVRIADAEGLEAVTMRRIAGELGIGVMSLYNYFPAKDHLSQAMTDQLAGEYVFAGVAEGPRVGIGDLARQACEIAQRHPWLAGLMQRPLPPGPHGLRYLDYFLGLLAGSRLDTGGKLEIIAMISGFATMYGALSAVAAGAGMQEQVQALARAAGSGLYPNLAAALAEAGEVRSREDVFRSCIERLIELAGLEPIPGASGDGGRPG